MAKARKLWVLFGPQTKTRQAGFVWEVPMHPGVLLQLLVDGLNSCYSGVFAGLGRQGAVSLGLFTFQWLAQLPGAFILGHWIGAFTLTDFFSLGIP